ncbi:MAG: glycosyltransferase family 2 protein [Porticoccaceae bacterium]|nr:glycosyltransferase family 2 protein [Porticoccaceae bacterium]
MINKAQTSSVANSDKPLPIAVVMITLNEAHNLDAVLDNIQGWAEEVFIVDSFSSDATVDIALRRGVHVVQRAFQGFGDQWNFALEELPITSKWTMKLDPDERLSDELKASVGSAVELAQADGFNLIRRLWFMGRPLPICQNLLRIWRTGKCQFTDVLVNEHPVVDGELKTLAGYLEHHDSPDLQHWYNKQNNYTSSEAITMYRGLQLAAKPKLFGTSIERRMWLKKNFFKMPFRYGLLFIYNYLIKGTWRAGRVGYIWSKLRIEVYRAREYKLYEMRIIQREPLVLKSGRGEPDIRVKQY